MAYRDFTTARAAGAALLLALGLAGCASNAPETVASSTVVQDEVAAVDPKDPLAPWVPYIREASERFDVPEKWIRAVMVRESGGRASVNGRVITSNAGAVGLMQVMPSTYEIVRWQYGLGSDPANPRDNILAGTAYLREMYDLFGAPGFLAAYNCGPACYASHLAGKQRLPRETKMYLASLTPVLRGVEPKQPSQSSGASAIEVAVVPVTATKTESRPEAQPASPPVAVAQLELRPEPRPSRPEVKPAREPKGRPTAPTAPVQFVAAADHGRGAARAMPAAPGKVPSRSMETLVAEAILPPNAAPAKGERVVIRFVSQHSGGCGSLQGKDRVCVALAGNGL